MNDVQDKKIVRKFATIPELDIRKVHGNVTPAEIYSSEGIVGAISAKLPSGNFDAELPVYRISPLGAELICGPDIHEDKSKDLKPGTKIDLTIKIGRSICLFNGLVVTTRHKEGEINLIGIRWCQESTTKDHGEDRRRSSRWLCGDEFLPSGIAPNPARFNDFVYFKILDISNRGMLLSTSLRNKLLVPGMVLEAMISFPLVGQISVALKLVTARLKSFDGKDVLCLGTEIISKDPRILETIGQYVLQFGPNADVSTLKNEGLFIRSAASALRFSYVKTAEDYREVLGLRRKAYQGAGKVAKDATDEELADVFDTRARILMAKHGNRLVGSLRLMFHGPEDALEHEQFMTLPPNFPRKDDIVEVTRICTDPDYRGSDLFFALMKHAIVTVMQSKRKWVLGSSTAKLLGMYERIGFKGVNIKYRHKDLGNEEHEVILSNMPKVLTGIGVGPTLWNELYADVVDYLQDMHDFEIDPLMNLRIRSYKLLKPFTQLISRSVRKPRASNKAKK